MHALFSGCGQHGGTGERIFAILHCIDLLGLIDIESGECIVVMSGSRRSSVGWGSHCQAGSEK